MPNSIGPTGLTLDTQAELVTYYQTAFKSIYGNDINLDPSTPDGQMMMVFIQSVQDLQDLLMQIYNQFDPDNAVGVTLDQRVAINGIQRQAGTHTVTNVTVTTTQTVTLWGTDQAVNPPYLVSDNEGTQYELITTVPSTSIGDNILAFQAVNPGAVLTTPNTINVPVTIVLGVTQVNNPSTYTTLGLNEESDAALKVRRQQSVSLSSQGYLAGLLAALENVSGVTAAFVYENTTGSTDSDGIPSHSIWVIVGGSFAPSAIANAIYTKRNAGCGMKGAQTLSILQADGTLFVIRWDDVTEQDLFIKFTATSLDTITPPNIAAILTQLPLMLTPGVNQQVNVNELSTLVQEIDPNTLVTSAGFSLSIGGSYTTTLSPSAKSQQFGVQSAHIIIIPIAVVPAVGSVPHSTGTINFTATGGQETTYTWTIHTNNSGGTINSSTGVYAAGASNPVTDVVRVTDGLGNFTDTNVAVT